MTWNGKQGSCYADAYPRLVVVEKIENILDSGKSHTYTYGIYDAVEVLVEVWVVSQQQPQHHQLCHLFWYSSHKEGIEYGAAYV